MAPRRHALGGGRAKIVRDCLAEDILLCLNWVTAKAPVAQSLAALGSSSVQLGDPRQSSQITSAVADVKRFLRT
jgi:hypothetical protein